MSTDPSAAPIAVHRMLDRTHQTVAATFEYPPSWRAESQVAWNFQHYALPVQLFGRESYDGP